MLLNTKLNHCLLRSDTRGPQTMLLKGHTHFWTPYRCQSPHFWKEASACRSQSQHLDRKHRKKHTFDQAARFYSSTAAGKSPFEPWQQVKYSSNDGFGEVCTCICGSETCSFLLWRPSMGGDSGGGLGKVNLTVYSLGLFSSSWASWLSSSCPFFFPFCCFLVRASLVCFSWMETNYFGMSTHTSKSFIHTKG